MRAGQLGAQQLLSEEKEKMGKRGPKVSSFLMERESPSRKFQLEYKDLIKRIFEGGKEKGKGKALPEWTTFLISLSLTRTTDYTFFSLLLRMW